MRRVELPPLPKPELVKLTRTLSCYQHTSEQLRDYGIACARAALDAALHACDGTQMLVAGHHPWTALQAQKRIGDAIRALSVGLEGAR